EIEKTKGVSLYSSLPEEQQKAHQIDEARSLVLIISHLARQHQPLIRRAVALIEQTASDNSETALLKDYIDNLNRVYREYRLTGEVSDDTPVLLTEKVAFKLLIDLLFYSDSGGHRRMWFGLLN
ncbi:MAG: DUF3038 domain-containing protein, partial [Cyanobacteriota bacterium]|nr:DUF3038 domain-containing protein [Cyanobacteriota bacterium]